MAFDISAITGAVNNYLSSISDSSKLLAQKESENPFDTGLSGIFQKYLDKAISDETGKSLDGITSDTTVKDIAAKYGITEDDLLKYIRSDITPAKQVAAVKDVPQTKNTEAAHVQRVDTSIPFPKFDIGSMIADNIASHNRFNTDTFSGAQHTAQREISAKGIDPYYSNMIKSTIKESDT
ncbi:hypothetical protein D6853_06945 [Butyrivibrio sp. X503]|uniref:hypothetical protein n=1 Tax=Butyrivibrio sp. X503 TaxID=2364878 RepID=UPI000EA99197|nr:hypothetical protein [Butyrivibrio sp. X503]RKM56517.1 hypothetical protein D6853_06945 [Butyrivibrio sp. X503]